MRLVILSLQWHHNGRDAVSNHQPHDCLLNRLFRHRSKKTSKLRVTGLCAGNSSVTGEFPAQMARNAENISIWWRHYDPTRQPLRAFDSTVYGIIVLKSISIDYASAASQYASSCSETLLLCNSKTTNLHCIWQNVNETSPFVGTCVDARLTDPPIKLNQEVNDAMIHEIMALTVVSSQLYFAPSRFTRQYSVKLLLSQPRINIFW